MFIEKVKQAQSAQNALDKAIKEIKEVASERKLTSDEYNFLYWETNFKTSLVDGKYNGSLAQSGIIIPKSFEFNCIKCGVIEVFEVTSRTKREEKKKTFICLDCANKIIEQKNKESEIKMMKLKQGLEQQLQKIKELKSLPYKEYLQTDHWQKKRKSALSRSNYSCQLCSSKQNLHVHHRTYINRGNEKYDDLIVLCKDCHEKHHDKVAHNE